jgi:LAGLIDADG endonuclease
LLDKIKILFNNKGKITIKGDNVYYEIHIKDESLNTIIPDFNKYLLILEKQNDFIIFEKILNIINKRNILIKKGLLDIISLKRFINKGLFFN